MIHTPELKLAPKPNAKPNTMAYFRNHHNVINIISNNGIEATVQDLRSGGYISTPYTIASKLIYDREEWCND